MKPIRLIALLSLLGCSHDAKRENPLDPELTPAVTLTAIADDSTGTVRLSWQASVNATFSKYLVLGCGVRFQFPDRLLGTRHCYYPSS